MWSKLVRQRDNDTCQVCGNQGHLNAHHVFTRSIKTLRFEPLNGISLCFQCHTANHTFSAHKTPEAFIRWFKRKFPARHAFLLRKKRKQMSEREAVAEFRALLEAE